jgi:transglutaminase-like putative cysteine protease
MNKKPTGAALLMAVLCVAAAIARIALADEGTAATLKLYHGEEIRTDNGLTFDGEVFAVPGHPPLPREAVQSVEFIGATSAGRAEGTDTGGAMTALTAELLPEAQALAAAHPGVGGVIIVDDGVFIFREGGTSLYRYHFAGLILKEEMKGWAQIAAGFTQGRSAVHLLYAHAVSPDGIVTRLEPENLHVTSPSEDLQFFNPNQKLLSGVIPGVAVGSVVEYAYESEQYNPEDPRLFSPGYYFQSTEPVVFSRARVELPPDVPFQYVTRNWPADAQGQPERSEENGRVSYTWSLRNMPPLSSEPYMPPQNDLVPMMEGTIFETFDEVYGLQRKLQETRLKLTPAIAEAAEKITAGAETPEEKLAALYHWVQTNTRYISIKGSLGSGLSGHSAQETFENRYGDCTDKAVLFATMCQAVGITSYPVILKTTDAGTAVTEIPTLSGNHCINEVELDGRSFYLDTTAQDYRYPYFRADDHGAIAFNAIRGDAREIPVPPPSENRRFSHLDIVLSAEGNAEVVARNEYTGGIEAGIRGFWKNRREDERDLLMAQYVNEISPGAVLEGFELSDLHALDQQMGMTLTYRLPYHAVRAKDLLYFTIPTLERDYPEVSLESRSFPIQYLTTEERVLEVDVTLPAGWKTEWTPEPLEFATPYLAFTARYTQQGDVLQYRESFQRLQRIIPVDAYEEYRDALRQIAAFSKQEVFLALERSSR